MFSRCPRCDKGRLTADGICSCCGYTLRISCSCCGSKNIPFAKYCGDCGVGLTFQTRLNTAINKYFDVFARQKFRKFAAGASFGVLLGLFAFGSMGMNKVPESVLEPHLSSSYYASSDPQINSRFLKVVNDLENFKSLREPEKTATFEDLNAFTELMVRHLETVKKAKGLKSDKKALDFLGSLRSRIQKDKVTRATAAMLIFNLAVEILDLSWKDFSEEPEYADLPRFHFLSVPANGLKELGIDLARNSRTFGMQDVLKIEQLYSVGIALIQATDLRYKQQMFSALDPL